MESGRLYEKFTAAGEREEEAIDVEQASASIGALIENRSRQRPEANDAEMLWKESVRKHNAKLRRERMAEWFEFYSRLAYSLRASADEFDARAEALLEETD